MFVVSIMLCEGRSSKITGFKLHIQLQPHHQSSKSGAQTLPPMEPISRISNLLETGEFLLVPWKYKKYSN